MKVVVTLSLILYLNVLGLLLCLQFELRVISLMLVISRVVIHLARLLSSSVSTDVLVIQVLIKRIL